MPNSDEIYSELIQQKGKAYRDSVVKPYSHYLDPIDHTPGRLAGNTHVWGDASPQVQSRVIDILIRTSEGEGLNPHQTAYVLAIARVESGFNPDAAAGTTSAYGLGQFVDKTGVHYGIHGTNRNDVEKQAEALVAHYMDNARLVKIRGQGEEYIYKYHHDGPTGDYGGLQIAKNEVVPYVAGYEKFVRAYQQQREMNLDPITGPSVSNSSSALPEELATPVLSPQKYAFIEQTHQAVKELYERDKLPFNSQQLDNIAMALANAGWGKGMDAVQFAMLNTADRSKISLLNQTGLYDYQYATLDVQTAAKQPAEQSLALLSQAAECQQIQYDLEQQRQLDQAIQQPGISMGRA